MLSYRTLLGLIAVVSAAGCGGRQDAHKGGEGPVARREGQSAASPVKSVGASAEAGRAPEPVTSARATAKRTWDNFPLDAVFFDDPGAELEAPGKVETSKDGRPEPAAHAPADSNAASAPLEKPAAAGVPTDWAALMPREELTAEVDEILGRFKQQMVKLEIYNGHYREIRVDASTLAVLAGVVARAETDVAWKAEAVHIRDVAAQLAKQADGLGPSNYGPAHESYEKLESLFGGNRGAVQGLDPNPIVDMPWINVADRSRLMQRMNTALEIRIKEAVASAAEFRKGQALVRHEADALATLAAVISTSYDSSEETQYQTYAAQLKQEALGLRDAATKGDFDTTSQRVAAVGRSCKACHDDYRFGDDF